MPIGVLSDESYERELESHKKGSTGEVLTLQRGRGKTPEVPESLRKVIAQESLKGSTNKELVKAFEVSQSSISAYKNGATSTSTYNEPNEALTKTIENEKANLSKIARDKMKLALDSITPEKVQAAGLKTSSQVAKDMSAIVKNMEKEEENSGNKVVFQFFAPIPKTEADYDIIDVKE